MRRTHGQNCCICYAKPGQLSSNKQYYSKLKMSGINKDMTASGSVGDLSDAGKNKKVKDDSPPLFALNDGKKPDYGTNNTLELLERIPSQVVEMKLDEVLTAVKVVDNLCDYPRCKTKTSLMGQDCVLCHKRFCFKHGLPEVHGCGDAAKKDERKKFLHPKPLKTVRQEAELAQAKKKLHTKLKDMQVSRMQKTGGAERSASGSKKKDK